MAFLQGSAVIVANTTTPDVLVNNVLAVSRGVFMVEWGVVASATGLEVTIQVGTQEVAPQMLPSLLNRFPIYPDDYADRFGIMPGDRILMRAINGTGGDLTVFFAFKFNPLG